MNILKETEKYSSTPLTVEKIKYAKKRQIILNALSAYTTHGDCTLDEWFYAQDEAKRKGSEVHTKLQSLYRR